MPSSCEGHTRRHSGAIGSGSPDMATMRIDLILNWMCSERAVSWEYDTLTNAMIRDLPNVVPLRYDPQSPNGSSGWSSRRDVDSAREVHRKLLGGVPCNDLTDPKLTHSGQRRAFPGQRPCGQRSGRASDPVVEKIPPEGLEPSTR